MSLLPGKFYLDDFFDDFAPMGRVKGMDMKCDIYEKGGNVHIELEVPGFNKNDIKIDVEDGVLTVEANKKEEKEDKDKNYYRKERIYGSTSRQFYVGDVDEDSIKANFSDGVLKVIVPKQEEISSKKKIEIE